MINNTFVIGLDIDGVVADLVNPILALHNFYYQIDKSSFFKKLFEKDITSYQMENFTGRKAWDIIWKKAQEMELVKYLPAYPGAIAGLTELQLLKFDTCKTETIFVTSPSWDYPNWQHERYHWLKTNTCSFDSKELVSLNNKNLFNGDLLIDDSAHNLQSWVDFTGKPSIKVCRPWNANYYHPYSANNWDEIVSMTKKIISKSQNKE